MPLPGLLHRSVARLGYLGLISFDLICNKDIYVMISLIILFHNSFDKF